MIYQNSKTTLNRNLFCERFEQMSDVFRPHHRIISLFRVIREWRQFSQRNFSAPSPNLLKMKTLTSFSNRNGVWVETGTYMGSTTLYLSKRFPAVITIEPSISFHKYAKSRLRSTKNVTLLNGTCLLYTSDAADE